MKPSACCRKGSSRTPTSSTRASSSAPASRPSAAARFTICTVEKLPQDKQPALRVMPMPADANQNGDIFGGWIMSQVDIAGGTLAGRVARGRIATVAVKEFVFKQPVHIGDLLSFYVDLVRVGSTSVTVKVEVYAERRPSEPTVVKVTEATLTYVAIDGAGRPRPVPRD